MKNGLYLYNGFGDPRQHNYFKKLSQLMAKNPDLEPQLHRLQIQHDDWCDMLNGHGYCNCDPNIVLRETE